jgi:outer membrane lipopolysaccharide assembly protein LptE/RlpB
MNLSGCGMRKSGIRAVGVMIVILLSLLVSCGYHISGRGGVIPEGARNIAVPVFFNSTNEPYVDVDLTQAVVEEFLTDGRLHVVDLADADVALRCRVEKYETTAVSFNPASYVQQYRIRIVVEAKLQDLHTKKILWQEQGIESNFISEYPVALGNIQVTRVAKEAAIKKAGQDIAWTLRSRILEGF